MKRLFVAIATSLCFGAVPLVAMADAPNCSVCSMKVDDAHNVHFRYRIEGKADVHLGSLSCAQKYWSQHKEQKMSFEAKDFVTGKYVDAKRGFFLVGSKLRVGTGMDKGGAIFFADRAMADRARKANGGKVVKLAAALESVRR